MCFKKNLFKPSLLILVILDFWYTKEASFYFFFEIGSPYIASAGLELPTGWPPRRGHLPLLLKYLKVWATVPSLSCRKDMPFFFFNFPSAFHMQNDVSLGRSHLSGQAVNLNIWLLNSVENSLCSNWDRSLLVLPMLGRVKHYFLDCLHLHGHKTTPTDARYCSKDFMDSICV